MNNITIRIKKKKTGVFLLLLVSLVSIALVSGVWVSANGRQHMVQSLQAGPIMLPVPPLAQSQGTSCGETVIVMAYNYAHPQSPLNE